MAELLDHSHPHVQEFLELRTRLLQVKDDVYEYLLRLTNEYKAGTYDLRLLVDIGFLCREIEENCDNLRKEAALRKDIAGQKIAFDMTKQASAGEEVEDPLQGELASGSPDVKMESVRPRPGSPENAALLTYLGVSRENADSVGAVFHADWKALSRWMTARAEQGTPPPPGIVKTYPVFKTVFRRKTTRRG